MRKVVRGAGGKYRVVKNNLAEKASEGTAAEQVLKDLRGMTSLAYTTDDPVALAKALTAYAKANPTFHLQGRHGGRPRDRRQGDQRPGHHAFEGSRSSAKLLYLINAPAQRLVTAMNAVGRNLAVVVDQGVKENKFQA